MRSDKVNWRYNFKVYFGMLKEQWHIALAVALVALISEVGLSIHSFLFKSVIDNGTLFLAGTLTAAAFINILLLIAGAFAATGIIRSLLKALFIHLLNILDSTLIRELKRKFFQHIVRLSNSFHTSHRTGALISRLLRGGSAIERLTDTFVSNAGPLLFNLIIVGATVAFFDPLVSIVIVVTTLAFVGFTAYINIRQQPSSIAANAAEDNEKAFVADIFTNIESIKYYGKEQAVISRYDSKSLTTKKALVRFWNYFRIIEGGQTAIVYVGIFLVIYIPLQKVLAGQMTLGTLTFIYTSYATLLNSMWGIVWGLRNIYGAMADFESLFPYLKIDQEVKDKPHAPKLVVKHGGIKFENVTFAYKKRKVVHMINLDIKPGMKIALVGPSGAGKSTIIKLLYRLVDVNEGSIKIDGVDVRDVQQESLRSEMSIVPQEGVLFDDTIYNNIAFSNPSASRADVMQAIRFAQLDKLLKQLPQKDRTIVGERGVKLSGGERQRVSIARAILANKKILVLDEATSALDSMTEHEIQGDLQELMKGRTSIIIAHRLSTILTADMIAVMDKGHIVQTGTHLGLIKEQGLYQRLWNLQKGGFIK